MTKSGYYPGTFYPFTNGHLHVVEQALEVFDEVYIGLHKNGEKDGMSIQEYSQYIKALRDVFKDYNNVFVIERVHNYCAGTVAQTCGASHLIRGIRNSTDYEYEENLAKINEEVFKLPTIYFRAGEYGYVSSSMVRELMKYNIDYKEYVPEAIYNYLQERN